MTDREIIDLVKSDDLAVKVMNAVKEQFPHAKFYVLRKNTPCCNGKITILCDFPEASYDNLLPIAEKCMPGYNLSGADIGYFHITVLPSIPFDATHMLVID